MRLGILIPLALALAVTALVWAAGGFDALARWAAQGQREVQSDMAGAIRALKAGEAGALAGLMTLAFAYGFFHAAGPGHGKALIGGYGLGRRVSALRLSIIALASSLAQALTAIALVYGGVFLLDWSRERMEGVAERWLAPASYAAIAGIGLWLFWRGLTGLRRGDAHDHAGCSHAHGPSPDDMAGVASVRDAALLIGGVALRPCTGALFLLVICWRLGVDMAGILGTLAMALGTATVTIAVALLATTAREGALAGLAGGATARRVLPALELAAGALILAAAATLLAPFV